ncbi:PhzF family phenazine biosynthesis protein [Aspergillus udagawae]|uniref:Uncharacterized protein n=1 Tax=Aspergillus udagawae TaxID=91492 RepID=A0A8E0QU60_9EURO|nr:uncharacterized protein Aud_006786 [Aspergillus udagawae]GIC90352.1 hypothetical protein Aud_006786 [Aspergillus udagawae]
MPERDAYYGKLAAKTMEEMHLIDSTNDKSPLMFSLQKGNPLAVVKVGNNNIPQERKQRIAREFNFSETVFLHNAEAGQPPRVDIFTPVNEMDFAGHPVIGAGHLLFRELQGNNSHAPGQEQQNLTILTKAGPVAVSYEPSEEVVSAEVPHNVHVHSRGTPITNIKDVQPSMSASDFQDVEDTHPTVSIVKGVTYVLMDLTEHPGLFANLVPGDSPKLDLDEGWAPSFTGIMYYRALGSREQGDTRVWNLRVRMIAINLEDPACGSGSCALGAYLALSKGQQSRKHRFYIDQGAEMGRDSHIVVDITLDEEGTKVSTIKLAGRAAFVAEGKIFIS